jgi:hypothetical protein
MFRKSYNHLQEEYIVHAALYGNFISCEGCDEYSNRVACLHKLLLLLYLLVSGFGGLGVCVLASGNRDRGFAPDRSRRIFHNGKIHSTQSFSPSSNTRTIPD